MKYPVALAIIVCLAASIVSAKTPTLDESPARSHNWGYRPANGAVLAENPPAFCWRPQKGISAWEVQCARTKDFKRIEYAVENIVWNVHRPMQVFQPGVYVWRYRGLDDAGVKTDWSRPREFSIPESAVHTPMPSRGKVLERIPKTHPRLFIRPEDLPRLRELARGPMKKQFEELTAKCDKLLANPPSTAEPKKYPSGMASGGKEWKALWWGNRLYTVAALDGAATLAFTRLLGGKEEYGQLAKRILLDCAKWDPLGATGYRYNDEAGMPYAYFFSRTYTFVNDLLSEEERETCRRVMEIRGREMYKHLCPCLFWRPYSSHSNRAWHYLGEVGVAFNGEIDEADDWIWFALNYFYNIYPVWADQDGGWHEGICYWSAYINRFTWWADVMRSAMDIDAYKKPYFAQVGYYPMYLMPPGKIGAGFGDGATKATAARVVPLVNQLAVQAGNGYWQWYDEHMGGPKSVGGYIGFARGALPKVEPKSPDGLPTSKLFRGTGIASLNTTLMDAGDDVQIIFKSSPMGTQSHGNASNNSFVLWAYGQRLLLRTGHYYIYGGPHHRDWVWSTRSLNNITVDGRGQMKRTAEAVGKIIAFQTTPSIDAVVGEAAGSYRVNENGKHTQFLDRFTRAIIFVKPELIIVYDRLKAPTPSNYEYWLHAADKFDIKDQRNIAIRAGDVACSIDFLAPKELKFTQTDQYDPNPWPEIKTREWHLTASTPTKTESIEFVALYRPRRMGQTLPTAASLKTIDGGYVLTAELSDGRITALLPTDDSARLEAEGIAAVGKILVRRHRSDGSVVEMLQVSD